MANMCEQGGHSSWKSLNCPGILFCTGNVLEDDTFFAEVPGKVLEISNYRFKIKKLKKCFPCRQHLHMNLQ